MCRCHLRALKPTRGASQASAEGLTEGHIAAQFTELQWPSAFRVFASTLEWIDTAPNISLHQPAAATTYHLSVSRHLTTTVSRAAGTASGLPRATGGRRRQVDKRVLNRDVCVACPCGRASQSCPLSAPSSLV